MQIAAALASLAIVAAQSAPAQPSADVLKSLGFEIVKPATPAEIAAGRAEGDAILAKAGAADLFDNVTTTQNPALRHKASGLVCAFIVGSSLNQVLIFREPRGDSIGCNTGRGRSYSVFLDRAPAGRPPVEQLIGPIAAAIVKRLPDAKPGGPVMIASGKDKAGKPLEPHKVAQFMRQTPQGMVEERLAVGYAGDWFLQQRITQPAPANAAGDLVNELTFIGDQSAIVEAAAAPAKP